MRQSSNAHDLSPESREFVAARWAGAPFPFLEHGAASARLRTLSARGCSLRGHVLTPMEVIKMGDQLLKTTPPT